MFVFIDAIHAVATTALAPPPLPAAIYQARLPLPTTLAPQHPPTTTTSATTALAPPPLPTAITHARLPLPTTSLAPPAHLPLPTTCNLLQSQNSGKHHIIWNENLLFTSYKAKLSLHSEVYAK